MSRQGERPFWSIGTDEDGSLRVAEPDEVWVINFGDLGDLNLVETKALGRCFKDWAWLVAVPQLLEENRRLKYRLRNPTRTSSTPYPKPHEL